MRKISKPALVFAMLAVCGLLFSVTFHEADAKAPVNMPYQLKENLAKFETLLNEKGDPEKLMTFLHTTISNDAQINLTINDPDQREAGTREVQLTKADYINSYLYGPRQVDNYRADINTTVVDVDKEAKELTAREILTESGIMRNPHDYKDPGRDFVSRTQCESHYALNAEDTMQLQNSSCHTEIAFPQSI